MDIVWRKEIVERGWLRCRRSCVMKTKKKKNTTAKGRAGTERSREMTVKKKADEDVVKNDVKALVSGQN